MARALLPICLRLDYADDPDMQAALAARVDLRRLPTVGRLRAGVDPLGAVRMSKRAPRANSELKKRAAHKEARQLCMSHPFIRGAWLSVWISPAVWEIARHLEVKGVVEPIQRSQQLVEGVSQRVSDLRVLGVVIVSTKVGNPRLPRGTPVVPHELVSELRTTPPASGAVLIPLTDELRGLAVDVQMRQIIHRHIDARAERRKLSAVARLNRATAPVALAHP